QNVSINNSGTLNANGNTGTVLTITATAGGANPTTGDLFISGGGTMQAPNVPPSGLLTPQVTPILLQATLNARKLTAASFIEFTGSQTFITQAADNYATNINPPNVILEIPNLTTMVRANGANQSIIIADGAQVYATQSLTLKSLNIAINGTGNVGAGQ